MIKQKRIYRDSYKYISLLIAQLLELDIYIEEKITEYIEDCGVVNFLKDIKLMDLPYDIVEKLESLQEIIESLEEEKEMLENDKNGDDV